MSSSRREFLRKSSFAAGAALLAPIKQFAAAPITAEHRQSSTEANEPGSADYTLHIKAAPIEIAPKRIISNTTYNGQFPGPLLRFKEGRQVTVEIYNDTDTPEQLHWHGQKVRTDVDGASEEGTPFILAHGKRRIMFTPAPAGFRFYHTHNRAGSDLYAGQYNGEVGPVYIEPKDEPGRHDREVFLVLKEFEPTFGRAETCRKIFCLPLPVSRSWKRPENRR
jgi:FtsP/CotA-like multicopper oxidase with cupredoxin domain